MGKAMGIATVQLQENLMVVGGARPECRKHSFQQFRGSSVGNFLGPITLPSFDDVWQVNWACKKDIYSASNLIGVGGKLTCDAEDAIQEPEARLKPRTAATKEPVFYRTYPAVVYDDLFAAFEVSNVIDLTPGDGTLAMACLRRDSMYVGFTFTQAHAEQLRKHIEKSILKAMLDEQDELYEPRLRAAVAGGATIDDGEGGIRRRRRSRRRRRRRSQRRRRT